MADLDGVIADLESQYRSHRAITALKDVRRRIESGGQRLDPQRFWHDLPYDEYLKSEYWRDVRRVALHRAGERCQLCNARDRLQVHHRCYTRRGLPGELEDLIVLCADCHGRFHHATND